MCLLCLEAEEIHSHVLHCSIKRARKHHTNDLNTLDQGLININTHTDLITLMHLSLWLGLLALDLSGYPEKNVFETQLQQQKEIGWGFFVLGFWSTGWR